MVWRAESKGSSSLARKYAAQRGFVEAALARQDQQRGLGRIAGDQPLPCSW
jgi:hypothetical protein